MPNNAAGTIPLANRRPIPGFGDITYSFNGGFSRYQSVQVKIESRLSSGLTLLNSLTFSQTEDNGSGSLENQNGNAPAPQDFYNLAADEGLSELPPAVQQHHQRDLGAADRPRAGNGSAMRRRGSTPSSAAGR